MLIGRYEPPAICPATARIVPEPREVAREPFDQRVQIAGLRHLALAAPA